MSISYPIRTYFFLELCRVLNFFEPCPDLCWSGFSCSFAAIPSSHWPCSECLRGHSPNAFTDLTKSSQDRQLSFRPRGPGSFAFMEIFLNGLIYCSEHHNYLCLICFHYHPAVDPCSPDCVYSNPCTYARPSTSDWPCAPCSEDIINCRRGWASPLTSIVLCPFSS